MAGKKGGLGKGLDTLIPVSSDKKKTTTKKTPAAAPAEPEAKKADLMVDIHRVEPNREQPRKEFDEKGLKELAESIKTYGILQPILVTDKKDYYQIVAGERRWRAARMAGLKEVPVIIRDLSDQEIMEISLIENIQREDLNPIEEAQAYRRLIDEFGMKQADLAKRLSRSRTAITNSMRLLKLSEKVQKLLADGKLSAGHARALITLEAPELQLEAANRIIEDDLNVRDTETLVKRLLNPPKPRAPKDTSNEALYRDLEGKMRDLFQTKVQIKAGAKKGKIEIEYYGTDDLTRLIDLFEKLNLSE